MQMKAYMKRTGSYMGTTRLTVAVICLLLLLVVSPLYGRRYDMAIVPNTDVNLAVNVRDVLNSAGGSVTNEVITFFQTRANINKWAKYKPYRKATNFNLDYSTDPTRADGCMWGMVTPTLKAGYVYFNKMAYEITTNPSQANYPNWEYQLPRGGQGEPYRLGDFKGYNTAAVQPFTTGITNYKSELNMFDEDSFTAFCMINSGSDFNFRDFFTTSSGYRFVVECYLETGMPFYVMDAPTYKQISGQDIANVTDWAEYIKIQLSQIMQNTSQLVGRSLYVCMGVQKISSSGSAEGGTGIVAPWNGSDTPFLKRISIVNYFSRRASLTYVAFTLVNPTWYSRDSDLTFSFSGTRSFCIRMKIERKAKGMYIIPENSSFTPSSGEGTIKIRCSVVAGTYQSSQFGQPANSSLQNISQIYIEPSPTEGQYQEFYLVFSSLLKSGTASYLVFEATSDNKGSFVTMDVQTVNITCR